MRAKTNRKRKVAVRKAAKSGGPHRGFRLSKARLDEMVAEATIDCYDDDEALSGFFTMIEENLLLPFQTQILGIEVAVEKVDMNECNDIVAICRRGKERQAIPILDLPLPTPPPKGAEWIEAYRYGSG